MKRLVFAAALAAAQFPPKLDGVKIVKSKQHPGVQISYKEPGICETTPEVKSYAGYVHLPPGYMANTTGDVQDYPINTFFWFFEARKNADTAPLAIWLNGGPGASSLLGALTENGPCFVNDDSCTTRRNPWSWNNEVNMLYIDQPNQVGFSYDVPTNGTVNYLDGLGLPAPADFSDGLPVINLTSNVGTFASQKTQNTARTSEQAAHALWNFAQIFLTEFPAYRPRDDRVSLWAESYGGHYGPAFFDFFAQQNDEIAAGHIDGNYIHLDTLGIVSGIVDAVVQVEEQITYAFNNSYNLQLIDEAVYRGLLHNFTKPGGCKDLMTHCQRDTLGEGCHEVESLCVEQMYLVYLQATERSIYDLTHPAWNSQDSPYIFGYMTQSDVLQRLGSPVNFTTVAMAPSEAFRGAADQLRGADVASIAHLLDRGVKVHMMYGDRDWVCNWVGGEKISLMVPHAHADKFAAAGYAHLYSDDGEHKGMTRQHGNFSFTRVFDAGHGVPSFQPQASYEIFMRAVFGKDVATGSVDVSGNYATEGPQSTWHIKREPGEVPEQQCYILVTQSCSEQDLEKLTSGDAVVKDFIVLREDLGDVEL